MVFKVMQNHCFRWQSSARERLCISD